jgi:tRNA pseudouridine55 synthase
MPDVRPAAADGMLLLDKAAGRSSFGAIAALRPVLGRKLGHAGTLDPFATGLLIVLAGKATRLATFLTGLDKRYRAAVRFGVTSTTDDPEGELTETAVVTDEDAVRRSLDAFRGEIRQVPPAASAIHIDGERAYRRFRRGEDVEVPARTVTVHAIELLGFDPAAQTADLEVHCSTGTYIRALARDLGDAVGAGGYCAALRRTEVGPFSVDEAVTADGDMVAALRPPAAAVPHLARRVLTALETDAALHGRAIRAAGEEEGPVALLGGDDRLVAIGHREGDIVRPGPVLG